MISLTDALTEAIGRTRDLLFRPFRPDKWLVLAFCAWLARLGQGGGTGLSNNSWRDDASSDRIEQGVHHAWDWVLANILLFAGLLSVLLLVTLAVSVLVLWISSRGKFMFLDGVIEDRAAVAEPWQRYRALANSLFGFRLIVSLLVLLAVVLGFAVLGAVVVASDMTAGDVALPILVAVLLVLAAICFVIAMWLFGLAIDDFIVPIMYLKECRVSEAWRELGRLVGSHPAPFVLYVLIKILISIVVATIEVLACCMTCCLVLVPYVGTLLLLPVHVFTRSFPLFVLRQCGSEYERLAGVVREP